MSRIYVDNGRKQIVFQDIIENEIIKKVSIIDLENSIQKSKDMKGLFQKTIDFFESYIFDTKEETSRYIIYPSPTYRDIYPSWINLIVEKSLYYLRLSGLDGDGNFNDYKADIHIHSYKNNTEYSPFYSLNDKNWDSSGNGSYFTDKLGHVCILCIKKDPSVKGGDLEFSPLYNEQNSMICGPSNSLTVPLQTGSVVLLSGDVYHRIQPTNIGEMYIAICYFYYGVRDY